MPNSIDGVFSSNCVNEHAESSWQPPLSSHHSLHECVYATIAFASTAVPSRGHIWRFTMRNFSSVSVSKRVVESTTGKHCKSSSPPPVETLCHNWKQWKGGGLPGTAGNTGKQWKLSLPKLVRGSPGKSSPKVSVCSSVD
jgi:hypothetical protein